MKHSRTRANVLLIGAKFFLPLAPAHSDTGGFLQATTGCFSRPQQLQGFLPNTQLNHGAVAGSTEPLVRDLQPSY